MCVFVCVCVCMGRYVSVFACYNHHGDLHGVAVGVGQVTEDEQRSLFSQRLSHREVPELGADVLHGGALRHTHTHAHTHTHTHTHTQKHTHRSGRLVSALLARNNRHLIPPESVSDVANQGALPSRGDCGSDLRSVSVSEELILFHSQNFIQTCRGGGLTVANNRKA